MSNTTIILDKEYFTVETTKAFLHDLENACKTMDAVLFAKLFIKYYDGLSFMEDYREVLDTILDRMKSWNDPERETELLSVNQFDSKCMFCKIGKTVKAYRWTYKHTKDLKYKNLIFGQTIAFYFDFDKDRLIEFGVCNGFLDKEEIHNLNTYGFPIID